MRKLILLIGVAILALSSQAKPAHAEDIKTVNCNNCTSMFDFLLHGAGAVYKTANRYAMDNSDRVWVTGNGSRVLVDLDQSVYRWFGIGNFSVPIYDYTKVDISGTDYNGKLARSTEKNVDIALVEAKWREIEQNRNKALEDARKKKQKEDERALDDLTWAAEAAAMNPAITIAMNQRYGYGFGNSWYRSPGACWGTGTGVMCQPY